MTSKGRQKRKQPHLQVQAPAQPKKQPDTAAMPQPAKAPARSVILAVCLLLSFVFYGNTLQNGYSLDDELVTLNQANVERGIAGIPAILGSRYSVNAKQSYEYRPVVLVTYAIEYQFFGRNPAASHFFNVLLYAFVCYLVYLTIGRLFPHQHWSLPVLTMLIFLVHPVHSEVVASLKNRDEMLMLLFALLSLNVFVKYADKRHWKYLVWGLFFFFLAMLSKKSFLPFIFIIPFTLAYVRKLWSWRTIMYSILLVAAVFGMVLVFKKIMLDEMEDAARNTQFFENPLYTGKYNAGQVLMMSVATFGFYVKLVLVPYPLVSYYGYNTFDGFSFGMYHVTGIAALLLFCWLVYRFFFTNKPLVWGIVLFVAGISMFTNLLVPAPGIVAERFAFMASVGISLVLAIGILALFRSFQPDLTTQHSGIRVKVHKNAKIAAAALIVVSALVVIPRNKNWAGQLSLYRADIKKVPNSAKLHSLLGTYYAQQLQAARSNQKVLDRFTFERYTDSSIYFFRRALEVYPDYTAVSNNLGTVYINYRYNLDSSMKYFSHAVKLDPDYGEALGNYAMVLETSAEIESEKLKWMEGLPLSDTGKNISPAKVAEQLTAHDQTFALIAQMKSSLAQWFNAAFTGKQTPGNIKQNIVSTIGQFSAVMSGTARLGIDKDSYTRSLLEAYSGLKRNFDRVDEVTDSVTAIYVNPLLTQSLGDTLTGQINREVYLAIEKQRAQLRQQAFEHYKRALTIRHDNGLLYGRVVSTLLKWNMTKELIAIHQLVLEKAKFAKRHTIEFNLARAYFLDGDYANGYRHTQKALDETAVMLKRMKACQADFTAAGNQFSANYFVEAQKVTHVNLQGFTGKYIFELRSQGMNAEAGKLDQRVTSIIRTP